MTNQKMSAQLLESDFVTLKDKVQIPSKTVVIWSLETKKMATNEINHWILQNKLLSLCLIMQLTIFGETCNV